MHRSSDIFCWSVSEPLHPDEHLASALAAAQGALADADQLAQSTLKEISPSSWAGWRQNFLYYDRYALLERSGDLSDPGQVMRAAPSALVVGLLAPFPWEWFGGRGRTRILRAALSLETVCFYLLIPFIICGALRLARRRLASGWLVLLLGILPLVPMALVLADLTVLVRHRLQVIPLLIVLAAGALISEKSGDTGRVPNRVA